MENIVSLLHNPDDNWVEICVVDAEVIHQFMRGQDFLIKSVVFFMTLSLWLCVVNMKLFVKGKTSVKLARTTATIATIRIPPHQHLFSPFVDLLRRTILLFCWRGSRRFVFISFLSICSYDSPYIICLRFVTTQFHKLLRFLNWNNGVYQFFFT